MANEWVTWAYQQQLAPTTKFVLVVMGDRADHEGYCWPSRRDIAEKTGLSERSVSRAISDLEENGYIKIVPRRRKDGFKASNGYYLQNSSHDNLSPENDQVSSDTESPDKLSPDTESRDKCDNSYGTECQGKEYNNKLLYSNPHMNPHTHARAREGRKNKKSDFQDWYENYPHKVGEGMARKEYAAARRKVDHQTLMEGVQKYIQDKPPDRQFCNPATWLREERWKDQPAKIEGKAHAEPKSNEFRNQTDSVFGNALSELYAGQDAGNNCAKTS